jgi:hypothetical protein
MRRTVRLEVSPKELALIVAALDSHIYWQLSDDHYRSDGAVADPGSDDRATAVQIARAEALANRLDN